MSKLSTSKPSLVTGAAGLIGFEITRQLLARGERVIACDSYRKGGNEDLAALRRDYIEQLKIIPGDLVDPSTLSEIKEPLGQVFHMAAIVGVAYVNDNPYETLRVNTLSTINVIDKALEVGCSAIVFASSSENYASAVDKGWVTLPTGEDVPLCVTDISLPRWSYAVSKIAGESAVFGAAFHNQSVKPVVVRFHNVYGPRMGPTHVIPEFLERCKKKVSPFPVYGYDATRSFMYVEDAARAVLTVAGSKEGGIFNIGSPEEISIEKLLDVVFTEANYHPTVEKHPAPPGSVKRRVPDISKLNSLGFKASIGLNEGIKRCLQK